MVSPRWTPLLVWLLIAVAEHRPARAAQPLSMWVFFRDKAVAPADLQERLRSRARELSTRALERRMRVRLDAGVDERDLDVAPGYISAVRATGARIRAVSRWLNAVSVTAGPEQLAAIHALPEVRSVHPVLRGKRIEPPAPDPEEPVMPLTGLGPQANCPDCGVAFGQLDLLQVPELHDCGLTGAGVIVAVLDTGFTLGHEAFATLDVVAQWDFIYGDDVVENEFLDAAGQHDHGTSVLSLLAGRDPGDYLGVAPDVSVILAKTEDISVEEPIEEDWFVEAIEWAESLGADILTASLGYIDWYTVDDLDGQTAVTTQGVNVAVENGLIVLSAAGNSGPGATSIIAPADAPGLIAVGAVSADGIVTNFSSRGPTADGRIKPDVCARGQANWVVNPEPTDPYEQGSGTSYATPMLAGVAALLLQAEPNLSPEAMRMRLTSTATRASTPDNDYGYGIVRGLDAVGLYCSCHDLDRDGYYDRACGGADCDDAEEGINPRADEVCNGIDDNCDGLLLSGEEDIDRDRALACEDDCDDEDPFVRPGVAEVCDDGVDNDCDGWTDTEDDACPLPPEPEPEPEPVPVEPAPDAEVTSFGGVVFAEGSCECGLASAPRGVGCGWLLVAVWLLGRWRRRRRCGRSILPT